MSSSGHGREQKQQGQQPPPPAGEGNDEDHVRKILRQYSQLSCATGATDTGSAGGSVEGGASSSVEPEVDNTQSSSAGPQDPATGSIATASASTVVADPPVGQSGSILGGGTSASISASAAAGTRPSSRSARSGRGHAGQQLLGHPQILAQMGQQQPQPQMITQFLQNMQQQQQQQPQMGHFYENMGLQQQVHSSSRHPQQQQFQQSHSGFGGGHGGMPVVGLGGNVTTGEGGSASNIMQPPSSTFQQQPFHFGRGVGDGIASEGGAARGVGGLSDIGGTSIDETAKTPGGFSDQVASATDFDLLLQDNLRQQEQLMQLQEQSRQRQQHRQQRPLPPGRPPSLNLQNLQQPGQNRVPQPHQAPLLGGQQIKSVRFTDSQRKQQQQQPDMQVLKKIVEFEEQRLQIMQQQHQQAIDRARFQPTEHEEVDASDMKTSRKGKSTGKKGRINSSGEINASNSAESDFIPPRRKRSRRVAEKSKQAAALEEEAAALKKVEAALHATEEDDQVAPSSNTEPVTPTDADIVFSRRNGVACAGTQIFRTILQREKRAYQVLSNIDKRELIEAIIDEVRSLSPQGRFISKDSKSGDWYVINDMNLRTKVSQAMRDSYRMLRKDTGEVGEDESLDTLQEDEKARHEVDGEANDERSEAWKGRVFNSVQQHQWPKEAVDTLDAVIPRPLLTRSDGTQLCHTASSIIASHQEQLGLTDSYIFLRNSIVSCRKVSPHKSRALTRGTPDRNKKRKRGCRSDLPTSDQSLIFYPEAPLGQLWLDTVRNKDFDSVASIWKVGLNEPPSLDSGGTVLGRRWVWDEGHYADEKEEELTMKQWSDKKDKLKDRQSSGHTSIKNLVIDGLKLVMTVSEISDASMAATAAVDVQKTDSSKKPQDIPPHLRAYCLCGVDHSDQAFINPITRSANIPPEKAAQQSASARKRRSGRQQGTSVSLTNVLGELARGELNPHTLITCEEYGGGPHLRFLCDHDFTHAYNPAISVESAITGEVDSSFAKSPPADLTTRTPSLADMITSSRIKADQVQPFSIKVCPDAVFLADLHSHLSESEVIGFLGGRYVESERCIYVQAAFPCRATKRDDSGFTDVEMDPVSQIVAGETIAKHGMMVVGWYHSHPSFQPDPSVTDVHNQGNYQHLFGDHGHPIQSNGNLKYPPPFVGLIIGTYDSKNPSAESVMRWFHVTPKETGNQTSTATNRILAKGSSFASSVASAPPLETETGWFKERVFFPMEIRVIHRKYRRFKVSEVEKDGSLVYNSRKEMTASGTFLRREIDSRLLLCALSRHRKESGQPGFFDMTALPNKKTGVSPVLCQPITTTMNGPSQTDKATHEKPANSLDTVAESSAPAALETDNLPDRPPDSTIATIDCGAEEGVSSKTIDPKALPSNPLAALKCGALMRNEKGTETTQNASTALTTKSPLLLDDILTESVVADSLPRPVYPLLFTKDELEILRLGEDDGVTDLIRAGAIWHAVEREQLSYADEGSVDMESPLPLPLPVPQSSQSILELLLAPPTGSRARASRSGEDENGPKDLLDDDAALVHIIDVILSHYSTDSQRIDPFGYWAGSGEKGLFGRDMKSIREKFEVNEERFDYANGNGWEQYYLEQIMGVTPGGGGGRMRRGHKICACLLKWARRMQLLPSQWDESGCSLISEFSEIEWDHAATKESKVRHPHLFFVTEVMRLLAARWREADEHGLNNRRRRRRRRRPPSSTNKLGQSDVVNGSEAANNMELSDAGTL